MNISQTKKLTFKNINKTYPDLHLKKDLFFNLPIWFKFAFFVKKLYF